MNLFILTYLLQTTELLEIVSDTLFVTLLELVILLIDVAFKTSDGIDDIGWPITPELWIGGCCCCSPMELGIVDAEFTVKNKIKINKNV